MLGIHVRERLLCRSAQITKRIFDVAAVICGGLVLSPLLLPLLAVHWVSIRLYSPGPLFYGQERIGKDGRRFLAWKLRTMVIDAERTLQTYLLANPQMKEEWDRNQKLRHDPRVLPGVGQLLRKSSLDELPQLWNVLVADMSLVGPRPFTPDQLEMYGKVFSLYRKVRPGITGLWQISGRNLTTFEERAKFDAYYVRNWSLWLDVFILGRTIRTVLFREGAY
jgi:Undecaprenyl-phosphate galactose phosphotransferase WbaP